MTLLLAVLAFCAAVPALVVGPLAFKKAKDLDDDVNARVMKVLESGAGQDALAEALFATNEADESLSVNESTIVVQVGSTLVRIPLTLLRGPPGFNGNNGNNGQDGVAGRNGTDGAPGEQGPPGEDLIDQNTTYVNLTLVLTDGMQTPYGSATMNLSKYRGIVTAVFSGSTTTNLDRDRLQTGAEMSPVLIPAEFRPTGSTFSPLVFYVDGETYNPNLGVIEIETNGQTQMSGDDVNGQMTPSLMSVQIPRQILRWQASS